MKGASKQLCRSTERCLRIEMKDREASSSSPFSSKESAPLSAERVALFQGILIGITLVVWGIRLYDFYVTPVTGWSHLTAPGVDAWLWPPFYMLVGSNLIYRWRTQIHLGSSSNVALPLVRRRILQRLGWVGVATTILGIVLLTGVVNLSSPLINGELSVVTLAIIAIISGVIYFSRRRKR